MIKKYVVSLLLALTCLPAAAVLKEKDLAQTLSVLRQELENYQMDSKMTQQRTQNIREQVKQWAMNTMQNSNEVALMLYSQKMDYIFDLTYACHQASVQYEEFSKAKLPFDKVQQKLDVEKKRYAGLIDNLVHMPREMLSPQEQKDRDVCLTLATALRNTVLRQSNDLADYQQMYAMMGMRLLQLKRYADERYANIRQNIFINGDASYPEMLTQLPRYTRQASLAFRDKYSPAHGHKQSQWRGPIIGMLFAFILFYGLISVILNELCIRFLLPKRFRTPEFLLKRSCIITASTIITFAVVIMLLWLFVLKHNFFIMASQLLVQYAWLFGVILISLLVRLTGQEIRRAVLIYLPIIVIGFIVIACRIVLVPNEIVNLVFPPVMLLCTIWQFIAIVRHNKGIPRSDIFYTWISFAVMAGSVVISWSGFTLMSVQLLIWWIMQLTCIQTITCIYDLLGHYETKHFFRNGSTVQQTWLYDFIRQALVPALSAASVMFSFYWATLVFELTDWCRYIFFTNFVNVDGVLQLSLMKIFIVVSLWFFVHYLVYVARSFFLLRFGGKAKEVIGEKAIYMKAGVVAIWSVYVLVSMMVLNISNSGILVAMGGLSTGIGFALKDTLENLFYGISLMTGRVHIGDIIECDGVRGKVSDINYQSTMVEATDGSIIAFLNSQLFNKNFKNLTRNHDFEIVKVPVGIAYGSDVSEVRDMLKAAIEQLDCYDKEKGVLVIFNDFGDNSVNLSVVVWVAVATKLTSLSRINETIYNVLNAHHVEIPYPQRDIYIRHIAQQEDGQKK